MTIKMSNILRIFVIVVVLYMLGYIMMFVDYNNTTMKIIASFLGIVLSLIVLATEKEDNNNKYIFLLNFLKIYIPIIALSIFYSTLVYNYSLNEILVALSDYLYVFYAFPIIYIFIKDKDPDKFLNTIYFFVLLILLIKCFIWFMYNYNDKIIFERILFQYSDSWIRNGFLRIDGGPLFDFAFCYCLYKIQDNKARLLHIIELVFLFLFNIIINQWRMRTIIMIIIISLNFINKSNSKSKKKFNTFIILLFLLIMIFSYSSIFDNFFSSFSVTGSQSASTLARVDIFNHYFNYIINNHMFLGLGLMTGYNSLVLDIISRGGTSTYWLVDLGVVSDIFTFGIMSIPLFGMLIIKLMKLYRNKILNHNKKLFVNNLILIMCLSCSAFGFFSSTRIFYLPFYLAIFSYYSFKKE